MHSSVRTRHAHLAPAAAVIIVMGRRQCLHGGGSCRGAGIHDEACPVCRSVGGRVVSVGAAIGASVGESVGLLVAASVGAPAGVSIGGSVGL